MATVALGGIGWLQRLLLPKNWNCIQHLYLYGCMYLYSYLNLYLHHECMGGCKDSSCPRRFKRAPPFSLSLSCGLFVATLNFCPIHAKHGRGAIMAKGCMGDLHSEDSKR